MEDNDDKWDQQRMVVHADHINNKYKSIKGVQAR